MRMSYWCSDVCSSGRTVAQHAVAADPGVDHADVGPCRAQPGGELVGPAIVAVGGCAVPVGDRITDRHDRARLPVGSEARTSVGYRKRASVGVDLGGCRILKKKHTQ